MGRACGHQAQVTASRSPLHRPIVQEVLGRTGAAKPLAIGNLFALAVVLPATGRLGACESVLTSEHVRWNHGLECFAVKVLWPKLLIGLLLVGIEACKGIQPLSC